MPPNPRLELNDPLLVDHGRVALDTHQRLSAAAAPLLITPLTTHQPTRGKHIRTGPLPSPFLLQHDALMHRLVLSLLGGIRMHHKRLNKVRLGRRQVRLLPQPAMRLLIIMIVRSRRSDHHRPIHHHCRRCFRGVASSPSPSLMLVIKVGRLRQEQMGMVVDEVRARGGRQRSGLLLLLLL